MISYNHYNFNIEREPLIRPFHFKGSCFTEKWLNVTSLYYNRKSRKGVDVVHTVKEQIAAQGSEQEYSVTAIGGNAVLWSDPDVFFSRSEAGGNLLMSAMAEKAVKILCKKEFTDPVEALRYILPKIHNYGKNITGSSKLRMTFSLNTLVSLDFALWKLYAAQNDINTFFRLLPDKEIISLANSGHFIMKIKIGHSGNQGEMLEKDLTRLTAIHNLLREFRTEYTENSKFAYYLDANGRYKDKNLLFKLISGLEKIKALDNVILIEEPFPDETEIDVHDIPVMVGADESLHEVKDVQKRIQLGYRAIALKPAGKTLSMSLMMAFEAHKNGIPCFVADSACVPLLLDWNRNEASLLPPFPGLSFSILESNGSQYYKNWTVMMKNHPCYGAAWLEPQNGLFYLNNDFYEQSGCVFK